jgi:diguanylate cyclase (GGDEF)-like protein/PAS domain S-box-containing protein
MNSQNDKRAVSAAHALTAAIVETALDAIIMIDHHGRVVEFNPAAERIFGYSRDDALGRKLAELIIPPLLRVQHRAGLKRYLATGNATVMGRPLELIAMRSDHSELPVELRISAVHHQGGPPLFIGSIRDLTDRNRIQHELRRTRELYELVLDNTQDLVSLVEPGGVIRYASPSHQRVLGYAEGELVGANVLDFVHPDDVTMVAERMAESLSSGEGGFVSEIRIRHKEGHWLTLEGVGQVIVREGEPTVILASARDISERKQAEVALLQMAAIVESTDDGVYSKSPEGVIQSWNRGAEHLYGYTAAEAIGRSVAMIIPPDQPRELPEMLDRLRRGERIEHVETRRLRKDGSRVHVSISVSPIRDSAGRIVGSSAIARDITDRKRAEEQIAFLAYHDSLTRLPNRARFDELLAMGLARARRHGLALALLYLDLDAFKLVNDNLGHAAGDELLQQVARRLIAASRETDGVARLGGDEFMVLVPDLPRRIGVAPPSAPDPAAFVVETVVRRIQESLRPSFQLGQSNVSITASIGVSIFPADADDPGTLFRNADIAMYQSKRSGPGRWTLFAATEREPQREPSAVPSSRGSIGPSHTFQPGHEQPEDTRETARDQRRFRHS